MDATASAIATCIIAMAREPSGAALGPSGVARIVLIPMRFQNVTVFPRFCFTDDRLSGACFEGCERSLAGGFRSRFQREGGENDNEHGCEAPRHVHPLLLRAATGPLVDCPEARLRRRAASHLPGTAFGPRPRRLCLHPRREIGKISYSRALTPANGTAKILIRRGLCPTTHTR